MADSLTKSGKVFYLTILLNTAKHTAVLSVRKTFIIVYFFNFISQTERATVRRAGSGQRLNTSVSGTVAVQLVRDNFVVIFKTKH